MSKRRIASVAIMIGLGVTAAARPARAYSSDTHEAIVSFAWETMRAASDPGFVNHTDWTFNPKPAPLSDPLNCDLCGGAPAAGEWNALIQAMQPALAKLNTLDPELPSACNPTSIDGTLRTVLLGMSPDVGPYSDNVVHFCMDQLGGRTQGGSVDRHWHAGGVFDTTAPNPSIDGLGFQGLALGWHSKSGDDDLRDVVLNSGLVTEIIVIGLIVAGLIALGILTGVGLAAGAFFFALILGIACIVGWISGDGCGADVAKVLGAITEDTGLESILHEAAGVVPSSVGAFTDSAYTGMWHYINAQDGGTNKYDDRRGLFYNEAGPDRSPGQLDVIIQAGLDLGSLHLDYDVSHGRQQYEILSSDDKHPNSVARNKSQWQGVTAAHLQFSPIDNFAFYGWSHFRGTRAAHWLRWPLHALGDVTVPMHIFATSSYGHRAYEDTLLFGSYWAEMRFLPHLASPEIWNPPAQTCFPGSGPDPFCPELKDQSANQVEQIRRVLWHALRWRRFIQNWRNTNAKPTDIPIRDLVTALAIDVRNKIQSDSDPSWAWCDDCSMNYQFREDRNDKGRKYYEDPARLNRMRDLVERSIGATVAFLVAAADAIPAPTCSTSTCSGTSPCCSGSCQAGKCCQQVAGPCDRDSDCCTSSGNPAVCRNRVCVSTGSNTCQGASHSCEDGAAVCCADSGGSKQCGTSPNGVNVCCNAKGTTCSSSAQCCTGSCKITVGNTGVCSGRPPGSACTSAAQCDTNEDCERNGVPVTGGNPGVCCNPSASASLDCTTDSDCCTGVCSEVSDDVFKCTCAPAGVHCARDNDCCSGNSCVNGTCTAVCKGENVGCSNNTECCNGVCCAATNGPPTCKSVCSCNPVGFMCLGNEDCCKGTQCCSNFAGGPVCKTACLCGGENVACASNSDCCVGSVCCAAKGFVCTTDCSSTCKPANAACTHGSGTAECCAGTTCCELTDTCLLPGDCNVK